MGMNSNKVTLILYSRLIQEYSYRGALRDQLRWEGFNVNMVGTLFNGEMADNV
jgi:hypothetical protein